jgi:hypothetical protein
MNLTSEQIKSAVQSKGYAWFERGIFNVNIVGVRNATTGNKVTNLFDDWMTLTYKDENGIEKFNQWQITTEAGKKGMLQGKAKGGVARLTEGQYRGSHMIRKHQGKYDALCQKGELEVIRDDNRNLTYEDIRRQKGDGFGINIHCAGDDSTYVENWSEGCQVFKRKKDFNEFMKIIFKAKEIHGNSFTYTLISSAIIK